MEYIKTFNKISKKDANIAGGKGASLGEMSRAGFPVPPGFVILASSFEKFLEETDLNVEIDAELSKVDHKEVHTVEYVSERIQKMILESRMPGDIATLINKEFKKLGAKYVAVRSSATAEDSASAAWAGQLDTFLNTTEENLLDNVKRCWASLFTPRAIFYRFEKELHLTKISVAVVVQKMVESDVAGIVFSVHPVTEDKDQLIIEAAFGLGEAVVSGQLSPDSYVVRKSDLNILDTNIAEQERGISRSKSGKVHEGEGSEWQEIAMSKRNDQKLSNAQIIELSKIIIHIENHYGFPCDIEWALENNIFYITQSRPITTLTSVPLSSTPKEITLEYAKYKQLFSTHGMSFLMSDIFMQYYKNISGLATFAHDKWTSFLPATMTEKTLKEGLALYGDKRKFNTFVKEINSYYADSAKLFEKVLGADTLTKESVSRVLNKMVEHFEYYSKTEFFYVDLAYREASKNPVISKNLEQFKKLKTDSRLKANTIFFQPDSYRKRLMTKLCEQFGLTKDDVSSYGVADILGLFDGDKLAKTRVKNRASSYLMLGDGRSVEYFEGQDSEKKIDNFTGQTQTMPNNQIKGTTARGGKVSASVTVIRYGDDLFSRLAEVIKKMPIGNVLVADSTSPELLMACKKASAILTNQGGMMSHAAIVSRELKIPCIVGFGNITDILKDGDMVEVDADKGVVRKI